MMARKLVRKKKGEKIGNHTPIGKRPLNLPPIRLKTSLPPTQWRPLITVTCPTCDKDTEVLRDTDALVWFAMCCGKGATGRTADEVREKWYAKTKGQNDGEQQ